MGRLIVIALTLLLSACHSSSGDSVTEAGLQQATAQAESYKVQVLNLINSYRDTKGIVRLIRTGALETQIQDHMVDITAGRVGFGHSGMAGRCERAREELAGGNACGEIVAFAQKSPQAVFDAWIASPGHRERISEGRYNRAGVGLAYDADGHVYWGVLFLEK